MFLNFCNCQFLCASLTPSAIKLLYVPINRKLLGDNSALRVSKLFNWFSYMTDIFIFFINLFQTSISLFKDYFQLLIKKNKLLTLNGI